MRRWLAGILLLLVWPGDAQTPVPFFSLSSDRTYAPGETPQVRFSAQNVDALEFRVYRVNDPVQFFRKLPDAHNFGGQAPPTPPARTLLERIHRWKQRTRFSMRQLLRVQFGDEEHQALAAAFRRAKRTASTGVGGDSYAEVPLLNPQQLVRTWRVPINSKNPWDTQVTPVEVPGSGLYIVEAAGGGLRAATIVSVTPLVVLTKAAPGLLIAQTVDRTTGAPAPALVRVLSKTGEQEQRSDANGVVRIPQEAEGDSEITLVVKRGDDFGIASVSAWALRRDRHELAIGYIYTDRPIYRPGHKVGFRAILRGEDQSGWRLPEAAEVDCEIGNPEGTTVDRRKLTLSKFGTVSGEWTIPANAPLGYYRVILKAGESRQAGSFQVEEYRKPEYEVKVRAERGRVLQGQRIEFTVDAKYFFGEPVANGRVRYTVRRARHWNWFAADYDSSDFEGGEDPSFYGEQIESKEGRLNAQGQLTIALPTRLSNFDEDYRVEARVMDEAKREIAARGAAFASVGEYFLQANPEKYVYAPGETARIRVLAVDYDRKPVAGVSVALNGARAVTSAEGEAILEWVAPKAGSHQFFVRSGRISAEVFLWVSGEFADPGGRSQITLVPEKKSYQPGETARVLVVTGVPDAQVMLGVESRALHSMETRKVAASSFVYEFPVRAQHMPNVFLTASFIRAGKYYSGSKSISVPASRKALDVSVQPSKPQFKPGEPARYLVQTKSLDGSPVEAEVSLGIVDEALYGVAPDTTPQIDKAFYGRTYDRVFTSSSLSFYFYGQAGKRAMPIARLGSRTLAQMKPPSPNDPRVRKAFPETAYWSPSVITDSSGRAEVRLQFPDSITAWRATARAVTSDTRVGSAVNRVITRKDLILRLAVPRFLTKGDETTVSAIVNNYLADAKQVRLSIEATGLEVIGARTAEGVAAPNQETRFDFRVRAGSRESARIVAKALTDEESDALEIDLPVRPFGVRRTIVESGVIDAGGKASPTITFPISVEDKTLELRAMPSLAGAVFGALDYLTTYPYGCTEQTLSSFVPNAAVDRAMQALNLPGINRTSLRKQINAGLERMAELQHPDGGWGFWESDDSAPFMTANAIAALNGFGQWGRVNQTKAKAWLQKSFEQERRAHPDFLAFLAYALNQPAATEVVWKRRDEMTASGLALLGLMVQGDRAGEIAGRLDKLMTPEGYWRSSRDTLMDIDVDNSAETTARAVKFLTRVAPDSPAIPRAVAWLVTHRDQGYYWSSTKQTAMVVDALTGYLEKSGELDPKLAAEIRVNGASVWNKELTRDDALSPHPAGLRVMTKQRENPVMFSASGRGRLYWSATGAYYDLPRPMNVAGGLQIRREYLRELQDGTRVAFDGVAKPGEVIVSRITVSGADYRYLMIEDPIPAGVELMKESRAYWTHRELRDDRAVIFETYFSRTRQYENRMKAVRPGKYLVSPANVEPMYQPGIQSISDSATVEILP